MKTLLFTILAAVLLLTGCNKSDNPSGTGGTGRLSVQITDDPFNFSYVESATVTITKIEARRTGDSSQFIVLSEVPVTVDLVQLRNGITEELANLEVPHGDYDLIRLYVDESALKIKDQPDAFKLKIPSGKQTGIKVFISPVLHVEGGLTSELILDFDLSRSFVMRGNLAHSAGVNGFIFKPCIRATNNTTAGRIEGFVRDSALVKVANAKVWVQLDTVVATSFADTLGHYAFIGMPAGTYKMFATQDNFDTASVEGVKVYAGNKTIQDFIINLK
jgi:hypothetical protein